MHACTHPAPQKPLAASRPSPLPWGRLRRARASRCVLAWLVVATVPCHALLSLEVPAGGWCGPAWQHLSALPNFQPPRFTETCFCAGRTINY